MFGAGVVVLGSGTLAARAMLGPSGFSELFQLEAQGGTKHEWKSIDKKHWQAVSADSEPTEVTDAREANRGACAPGMIEVRGKYKLDAQGRDGDLEELQNSACVDWISRDFPARCKTFDRQGWLDISQKLPTKALHFCIDRFEYPNQKGQNPIIVATYNESAAMCKAAGKRLCGETEWTFACEGEEATPYPYGYERDPEACVVDRPWKPFSENGLAPRDGKKAREEIDRLWQGTPSGSNPRCKSPFGVYDMTGNVDEWTKTARTTGYQSVLKGGYWGPVRARCRPATRAHNEDFVAYQQGFRCCSDPNASNGGGGGPAADGGAPQSSPSASAAPSAAPSAVPSAEPVASGVHVNGPAAPGFVDTHADEAEDESETERIAKQKGLSCDAGFARGSSSSSVALAVGVLALGLATRRARRKPSV